MPEEIQASLFDLAPEPSSIAKSGNVGADKDLLKDNELPNDTASSPESGASAIAYEQIPTDPTIAIPPGTYATLEALAHHCGDCVRCELHTGRTNIVVQRGNPQASIMIIGEGPGQNEDEQGQPFVGKSGQLLDKILQSVELDPNTDIYICNVVKCRPPGNRTPTPAEMNACKPYLMEQIRLIDPKIILLTGATAVRAILKEKRGITKIRGQWFDWEGRLTMPIFHPAYLLRNQSRQPGSPKWLMWQDIQQVKDKYLELGLEPEF